SPGDIVTATATLRNRRSHTVNMVMLDLGIPPGFELLSEDLDDIRTRTASRKSGRLEKFTLSATHATLYYNSLSAGETATARYRLRAKNAMRAGTFASSAYEYYTPEVRSVARPVRLDVRGR